MDSFDITRYPTFATRLAEADNRPSGFDYMRLMLALSIIGFHSYTTSYGTHNSLDVLDNPWRVLTAVLLPMFFALSGFLVAGSFERSRTLGIFLGLRVLRILPALIVEVILSALVLGPWLTQLSWHDYVSSPQFVVYFLNIVGDIHYLLPGVFAHNPVPYTVNAQLWTVPYEMGCYATLTVLAIIGLARTRVLLLGFFVLLYLLQFMGSNMWEHERYWAVTGETLIMTFLAAIVLYQYRDKIPLTRALFIGGSLLSVVLLHYAQWDRFVSLPLAYVTIYIGLYNPARQKWLLSGDYSYGLFLYGYAIQQAVMTLGPKMHHWYFNMLVAVPCTACIAVASWWCVEKPALRLRRYL